MRVMDWATSLLLLEEIDDGRIGCQLGCSRLQ